MKDNTQGKTMRKTSKKKDTSMSGMSKQKKRMQYKHTWKEAGDEISMVQPHKGEDDGSTY